VRIEFKLQVPATPGFHSLYDWYYQIMWLFSGAPNDPEDKTVMEIDGAIALYSAVKSLIHAICTAHQGAQQDAAHRMIQIAKLWMIMRWSQSNLTGGKPLVWIRKENAHLVRLQWNGNDQASLKTVVE